MLRVGAEGHLSRLLPDESLWGGYQRKGEGAQQTLLQHVNTRESQMDASLYSEDEVTKMRTKSISQITKYE